MFRVVLFLILLFLFPESGSYGNDVREIIDRLYTVEKSLLETLSELEKKEGMLWKKLAKLVNDHLNHCCMDNLGLRVWDHYTLFNKSYSCFTHSTAWYKRLKFVRGTSLSEVRRILAFDKVCRYVDDIYPITPPIQNGKIREVLSEIERVRMLEKRISEYQMDVLNVRTSLKIAEALKSARLSRVKKRALGLLKKIDEELSEANMF